MKNKIGIGFAMLASFHAYGADSDSNTRTLLLKNATPYGVTLEDKSTNEKWSVSSNDYKKILLHTQLPVTVSPALTDEEAADDTQNHIGEMPFPHTLDLSYVHDGKTTYITDCVTPFPEQDSIIQVFVGNSGIHCVMSHYQPD
jgi:hypothetical protein